MLVLFSPIFVADTKIIFVFNFVASLNEVFIIIRKIDLPEKCLGAV